MPFSQYPRRLKVDIIRDYAKLVATRPDTPQIFATQGNDGRRPPCQYPGKAILFPYIVCNNIWETTVLAKLTSKNQLTLPKAVTTAVEAAEYFDVTTENGRIVLTPVRVNRADGVRAKLAALGLSEQDVSDAVSWARSTQ